MVDRNVAPLLLKLNQPVPGHSIDGPPGKRQDHFGQSPVP